MPRLCRVLGRRSMAFVASSRTLKDLVKKSAEFPHMDALKMATEDADPVFFTYKELDKQVNAFAEGIHEVGFKQRHSLVLWGHDCAENIVAQLGASKAGVRVKFLDATATDEQLITSLDDARMLIVSPFVLPEEGSLKKIEELVPEIKKKYRVNDNIIESARFPALRFINNFGFERYPGMLKFSHLMLYKRDRTNFSEDKFTEVQYVGNDTVQEFNLPYIDSNVKMPVVPEAEDVC
ncbi:hypothetical protein GUITHDRAFT_164967 [Guillardia theta CCMP2712]|uniref:AMP-dependent synthetase/ligase domain-containing protein n=1 Tax=Guillardia theta (strain CCMP2712) TaxID=905079 RepID=L1ITC3_GUITC|nr:hypothetical protein GUITHDRAFT_164967 [Guillardia theta CCMP2712]EKX39332.1 hypothetical protein GUITHDRAFT_164967 [Guillardia theta CCMP2712]|mmetsp:Transcript_14274/g.48813  ORF Transcript_14274/g.48813 Transcript_14274/m.48813 type:complete len:236 (-) Transcript_14274:87-794(-)|eukprot:XP_005826312.1 hypothetical protein GUITHDRAFT_164967 [Guillardia theta CCMP2712]